MNARIIREDSFSKTMTLTVEPWLKKRRTILWARRKSGQGICCERYLADAPRGVILISHGFTDSVAKYTEAIWYFLQEGYHVYIPEHCGHGHSYRLTDDLSLVHIDNYERYLEDFLAVAHMVQKDISSHPAVAPRAGNSRGSRKISVYAHSMGGGIAAAAAARDPALFREIILSAPMIRPLTGPVPYHLAGTVTAVQCSLGKQADYVSGQHPYTGPEDFTTSAAVSRPRFDYYQAIKAAHPLFQTSAASNGWLRASMKLSRELTTYSWKKAGLPMLMFQAEKDDFVSADAQTAFAVLRNRKSPGSTTLQKIHGTKHEIYNSSDPVLAVYWREIFDFLDNQRSAVF
ncbi:MAG: alpha/beta hydrolase [Clostridiales bacterium]|nr:alpha/beta hydrolase [Clostridiales bacterium]